LNDEEHYFCAAVTRTADKALPLIGACNSIILSASIVGGKGLAT